MRIKLLTWNTNHRTAGIAKAIERHDPDVVVLTECKPKGGRILLGDLRQSGMHHQAESPNSNDDYGVYIASKLPLQSLVQNITTAYHPQRWLPVYLPDHDIEILAVHIPGSDDKKWNKAAFWQEVLKYSTGARSRRAIIAGDLNTGLAPDSAGTPFHSMDCFEALIDGGWVDAWRIQHPHVLDYSWFNKASGNGFRLDHAFVAPSLSPQIVVSYYSHGERISGISDHSPLLLELCL